MKISRTIFAGLVAGSLMLGGCRDTASRNDSSVQEHGHPHEGDDHGHSHDGDEHSHPHEDVSGQEEFTVDSTATNIHMHDDGTDHENH